MIIIQFCIANLGLLLMQILIGNVLQIYVLIQQLELSRLLLTNNDKVFNDLMIILNTCCDRAIRLKNLSIIQLFIF